MQVPGFPIVGPAALAFRVNHAIASRGAIAAGRNARASRARRRRAPSAARRARRSSPSSRMSIPRGRDGAGAPISSRVGIFSPENETWDARHARHGRLALAVLLHHALALVHVAVARRRSRAARSGTHSMWQFERHRSTNIPRIHRGLVRHRRAHDMETTTREIVTPASRTR